MTVRRIVANIAAADIGKARTFYGGIFDMNLLMDHGWIETFASKETMTPQVSIATEGGSGTPVPALSIEVDNLDEVLARVRAAGFDVVYGPADEPWGVRRFYVRDPFGTIVNVLSHEG